MPQRIFQQTYHIPGTWAANHTARFKLPCDAQLIHVSVNNSTANAGQIKIGTSADDAACLALSNYGVSGTPVEYCLANFVGAQYPHIEKGTILVVTMNDHASHMAAATAVLTFTEG